ncbi:hypothetical protein ACXIT0_12075 [Methylorubrum extorquens]
MKTLSIDQYVDEYGKRLGIDDDANVFSLQVTIAVLKELTEDGDVHLLATKTDLTELYRRVEVAKKAARKLRRSRL